MASIVPVITKPGAQEPVPAVRAVDQLGRPTIRSGQSTNDGFLECVLAAYANLVYHPLGIALFFISIVVFIEEHHNNEGPLEKMLANIEKWQTKVTVVKHLLGYLVGLAVDQKTTAMKFLAIASVYCCKPSRRTLTTLVLFALYVFIVELNMLEVLVFTQLLYLYCVLRNPGHKMLIFLAMMALACFETGVSRYLKSNSPGAGASTEAPSVSRGRITPTKVPDVETTTSGRKKRDVDDGTSGVMDKLFN